jgi:hypothetical protein
MARERLGDHPAGLQVLDGPGEQPRVERRPEPGALGGLVAKPLGEGGGHAAHG